MVGLSFKMIMGAMCMFTLLLVQSFPSSAQIEIYPIQDISFGAFYSGSAGGTLTVAHDGSRSATGDIIPMNMGFIYSPAVFEIEAPQGTVISILKGPDVTLSGSNGGSMILHIEDADVGPSFNNTITPPGRTQIKMGGTLTAGNSASTPPGTYNGTFSITFIYE